MAKSKTLVRADSEVMARAKRAAADEQRSLNSWIVVAMLEKLQRRSKIRTLGRVEQTDNLADS